MEDVLRFNLNASKEDVTMTMIRTLAFAGLTVIASMGAASAATAAQAPANEYQGYYQAQDAAFLGNGSMSDATANSHSCYRGVLPFRIQTCGVE
jgi:hypothetical protein